MVGYMGCLIRGGGEALLSARFSQRWNASCCERKRRERERERELVRLFAHQVIFFEGLADRCMGML